MDASLQAHPVALNEQEGEKIGSGNDHFNLTYWHDEGEDNEGGGAQT